MRCELGTIATVKGGKRLPKGVKLISIPNDHPYIRVRDLGAQRTIELNSSFEFVDDETQKGIARYIVDSGDILLSIVGTIGLVAVVGKSLHHANLTENCVKIVASNSIDKDFLYYYLKSPLGQAEISRGTVGAVQAKLPIKNIQNISVWLPDRNTQKQIAATLRCIDDKIELNQRINENLERQAEAIFKKHFVDIEELPLGWKKGNLLDIADYLNGLAMQKFRPKEEEDGIPVLKIKELRKGCCDGTSELCSPSIKPEYIIKDGDIIFSWSGSLLVDIWCGGNCALNQHLFKVTSKQYDKWFYYLWTVYHLEKFIAVAADKATTMGHIKREELSKAEVIIPSAFDYEKISAIVKPIYGLVISNRIMNRQLAKLRDGLLPKLMSGEIDVRSVSI